MSITPTPFGGAGGAEDTPDYITSTSSPSGSTGRAEEVDKAGNIEEGIENRIVLDEQTLMYPNPSSFVTSATVLAQTVDTTFVSGVTTLNASGRLFLNRFRCVTTGAIGHVGIYVNTAGATLTSGDNFIGIYDTGQTTGGTATLLCQTADQTTNWLTAGQINGAANGPVAFTSSPTITAGQDYFLALLGVGTTMPHFSSAGSLPLVYNYGIAAGINLRSGRHATSSMTSLPSTITSANIIIDNGSALYWACITT